MSMPSVERVWRRRGFFAKRGVNQTWYMRRRYRYLHVAYSATLNGSDNLDISVDVGNSTGNDYTHGSSVGYQWRTFDLNVVGGTTAGGFYPVTVTRSGNDFSFSVEEIRESESSAPSGAGSYVTPPTWAGGEVVGETKLNQLSGTILSLASVANGPSSVTLSATDSQTYRLRRRHRYVLVKLVVGGNDPDVDVYVAGQKVVNNAVSGDHIIDLAAVAGGPAVGSYYDLTVQRTAGSMSVAIIQEVPTAPTAYASTWTHGEQVTTAAKLNAYATQLNEAQAVLGNVGWQFAAIHRPWDHPRWGMLKTKRYLHYMRNGGLPATLIDPSGENDDISLSRTSNDAPFAVYDLDSIDWLAPGGLFYAHELDVCWLDDEP
jgi:hypothetical protein